MLNPAARLCSICVILLYVYPCAYTCASLQTPAEGLKMPSHPQRQQSPNTSVTDPSFYCSYISFLLIFLFISSCSHPSNSISHLPRPFTLFFFYHFTSVPLLLSLFTLSFLISVLPSLGFTAFCFLRALSLSQSTRIPPFFFFFISLSFIPSIRTIFASLYIYCHTEGKISEAEMIYVWYKLSIEPHWFSA